MVQKVPLIVVIALGSFCFTFSLSVIHTPGIWLLAGVGLTLALASTAQYIAEIVEKK